MIPVSVMAKLASLKLDAEQAEIIAGMLSEVEAATEVKALSLIEARRANDRERKARQRSVTSREVTRHDGTGGTEKSAGTDLARACVNPNLPTGDINYIPPITPPTPKSRASRSSMLAQASEWDDAAKRLWEIIPKRNGDTFKPFRKAVFKAFADKATEQEITAGIHARAVAERGIDPQYRKGAAAWINGDGWKAEYSARSARAGPANRRPTLAERFAQFDHDEPDQSHDEPSHDGPTIDGTLASGPDESGGRYETAGAAEPPGTNPGRSMAATGYSAGYG